MEVQGKVHRIAGSFSAPDGGWPGIQADLFNFLGRLPSLRKDSEQSSVNGGAGRNEETGQERRRGLQAAISCCSGDAL